MSLVQKDHEKTHGILGGGLKDGLQLKPVRYQWAYDLYNQAVANTWFPNEIQLIQDLSDYKKLSDDEKHAFNTVVSYLNPNELLINKSIAFGLYPFINAAEAHLYLSKQMWEEANHCMAFEYILETFPIDRKKSYAVNVEVPEVAAKGAFQTRYIRKMMNKDLDILSLEGKKDFVRNLVSYNIVLEGIWFYSSFMVGLAFRQRNLLRNFGTLIDWTVRDETLHLKFGINLLLTILEENEELRTPEFAEEIKGLILEAVELEEEYNKYKLPKGILGMNAEYVNQYVRHMTDRRLEELGFEPHFNVANPAKWMAAANDTFELVNFFESTNTSYEVGGDTKNAKSGKKK